MGGLAPSIPPGMSAVPFKANADRRHHIPKQKHRVTNWAEYDAALRQRGSLTVWFTDEGRWCTFRTEGEVTPAREPLCDDALATNGDRASCLKHPIQNRDADGCLGLLGGEAACSQPRSDQCLVSAHRRFDQ